MSILQIAIEPKVSLPLDRLQWTWHAEDAPVRIQVPLDVVARLRSEIESDESAATTEIGGVLLGRAGLAPGSIEIHDFAWVPSQEVGEADNGYRLDVSGLEALGEAHPNLQVLGYFRTQLDGALHLRLPEIDFVTERFTDRSSVVLLIRTSEQYKAGFLFWEGDNFIPFSVRDFRFDAESLRRGAAVRPVEIREEARVDAAAPDTKTVASEVPPVFMVKAPAVSKAPRRYLRLAAVGVSSLMLAGLGSAFLMQDRLLPAPRLEAPVVVAGVPIGLQAEAQEEGLDIRWNPRSGPVETAREARLALMQPNGQAEIIPVDLQQLASGQMHFASWGASVEVRLEVVDNQGRTTRESFSALQLGPEPDVPVTAPVVVEKKVPAVKVPGKGRWSASPKAVTKAKTILAGPLDGPVDRTTPAAPVPVSVAPVSDPEAVPAREPGSPDMDSEADAFAGSWTYSRTRGRYDGVEPEVVDGVIHEQNGHLSGTVFVHFKRGSEDVADFTHKFQFGGDLHRGRTQVFALNSVAGAKGTIELVAGNSPDLLEVHFQTGSERGAAHSGKMVLVKK